MTVILNKRQIKKRATIKDVAREAGVSAMTVVNVLKGRNSEVSELVAAKVRKKATALGYVKNQNAASLVNNQSNIIALIMINAYEPGSDTEESDINPFYGELILRLEREVRMSGYKLSVYGGNEKYYINYILEQNVAAAVLIGATRPEISRVVADQGAPVILVDYAHKSPDCMMILTDEIYGGFLAAEHLILKRNCKKIAFVGDIKKPANSVARLRYKGALKACTKHGVTLCSIYRLTSFDDGYKSTKELVGLKVDGVVAAADILAAGIIRGLKKLKVRIPSQIAVVGYDNILTSRLTEPAMTTIDQRLGEKVRAIVRSIKDGFPGQRVVVKPQLIIRESA